jgi:hypothetical protein
MTRTERIRKYLRHLEAHRAALFSHAGVHHVDVGWRYVDGRRTDRLAIRLFVRGRKRKTGAGLVRRRLEGLPLDVIATPRYQRHCAEGNPADPSRLASTSVQGGLSIGTRFGAPLTLGMVVRRLNETADFAITAIHLGVAGSEVFLPAPTDAPGGPRLGQVVEAGEETALIAIDDPARDIVGAVIGAPLVRDWVRADELPHLLAARARLTKSGRTTAVTQGLLEGLSDGTITIGRAPGARELACGGDSGSIWMTADGRAVALHYGGDGKVALAWALHRVFDRFNLRLV